MPMSQCGPQFSWGTCSPNNLVRLEEQRRGNREAKRLRGLEIDNQLELYRLLDGQVSRFGSFQDLIHVGGSALEHIGETRSIRHQTASLDKLACTEHRREAVLGREVHNGPTVRKGEGVGEH